MIKIELLFLSLKKIIIITNDSLLPNIVKNIYPYIKVIDSVRMFDENVVLIEKRVSHYTVKYNNFEYNDLNTNNLYYFLYEIIQVIIEEYMISNSINVLHGSCVEKNGKAYVFSAKTNTGKSTLITELIKRSYNYISDDYAILDERSNKIIPLHLPIKLRSLIPLDERVVNQVIVRDYNPIRDENYYLVKPYSYCSHKPFVFQALFQINRNPKINSITSLDYKDSYKTLILNSKIPEMKALKQMNILAMSLVKFVKVYNIDYVNTEDCIKLIESAIVELN